MFYDFMNVEIGAICDAATADNSGKLNMLGVFDTIFAQKFPTVHPHSTVVFRLCFEGGEEIPQKFRLLFLDDEGKEFIPPLQFQEESGQKKKSLNRGTHNVLIGLNNLKIPKQGEYRIQLECEGKMLKEVRFSAKKVIPAER